MKYLLDTNICIYLIKKKPIQILKHIQKIDVSDICLSTITLSELIYGVEKSQYPKKNSLALTQFIAPFEILSYDDKAASVYGKIRSNLEKAGQPIGAMDLLIAAQAKSNSLILVTNNKKEFSRIPELKIENWVTKQFS